MSFFKNECIRCKKMIFASYICMDCINELMELEEAFVELTITQNEIIDNMNLASGVHKLMLGKDNCK